MKETSGEFSMTVVVIIGAIILVSILGLLLPQMSSFIQEQWEKMVNNPPKVNLPSDIPDGD